MTPRPGSEQAPRSDSAPDGAAGRSYLRVLVIWVIVLTLLYAFQQYFS